MLIVTACSGDRAAPAGTANARDTPTCRSVTNSWPEGARFDDDAMQVVGCFQNALAAGTTTSMTLIRRATDGAITRSDLVVTAVGRFDVVGADGTASIRGCTVLQVERSRGVALPCVPA